MDLCRTCGACGFVIDGGRASRTLGHRVPGTRPAWQGTGAPTAGAGAPGLRGSGNGNGGEQRRAATGNGATGHLAPASATAAGRWAAPPIPRPAALAQCGVRAGETHLSTRGARFVGPSLPTLRGVTLIWALSKSGSVTVRGVALFLDFTLGPRGRGGTPISYLGNTHLNGGGLGDVGKTQAQSARNLWVRGSKYFCRVLRCSLRGVGQPPPHLVMGSHA